MIYLVDGVNGAGKSTWINSHKNEEDYVVHTTWLNPLRYDSAKRLELSNGKEELYHLFSYETLLRAEAIFSRPSLSDHYWDRSFLSAYVYGSISLNVFNRLMNLVDDINLDHEIEFVYVDTDINLCVDRLNRIRETCCDYKDYVKADTIESMHKIKDKFDELFKALYIQNYKVRYIQAGNETVKRRKGSC